MFGLIVRAGLERCATMADLRAKFISDASTRRLGFAGAVHMGKILTAASLKSHEAGAERTIIQTAGRSSRGFFYSSRGDALSRPDPE